MAHLITATELKNLFENQFRRPRNLDELLKLVERKVLSGTDYNDAINNAVALAQNRSVESTFGESQETYAGRVIGDYSGFSRVSLKSKFKKADGVMNLDDADVDVIFALLGVVE